MADPLNDATIQGFIASDKIVSVSCPECKLPPLHGKFVSREDDEITLYSFRPFKKGFDLPFLPAAKWFLADAKDSASNLVDALLKGKKGLGG